MPPISAGGRSSPSRSCMRPSPAVSKLRSEDSWARRIETVSDEKPPIESRVANAEPISLLGKGDASIGVRRLLGLNRRRNRSGSAPRAAKRLWQRSARRPRPARPFRELAGQRLHANRRMQHQRGANSVSSELMWFWLEDEIRVLEPFLAQHLFAQGEYRHPDTPACPNAAKRSLRRSNLGSVGTTMPERSAGCSMK